MIRKTLFAGLIGSLVYMNAVEAGTVTFDPADITKNLGETFSINIKGIGFAESIVGGGLTLSFNKEVVTVESVVVDGTTWEFQKEDGQVDNSAGKVDRIIFNSFQGRSGDFAIASVLFKGAGVGSSPLTLAELGVINPFADDKGNHVAVTFGTGLLNVSAASPVPVPAAAWLLFSGVGAVAGFARKKRAV